MTREQPKKTAWRIFRFGLKYWKLFLLLILLSAAYSAAFTSQAALVKPFMDDVVGKQDVTLRWEEFKHLAMIAILLACAIAPLKFLRDLLSGYIVQKVVRDMRGVVHRHILRLPLAYFHQNRSGDMISRVTNDVQLTENAVKFFYDDAILQPLLIANALALAFVASWQLSLVLTLFMPLIAVPLIKMGRRIRKKRTKSLEQLSNVTDMMVQSYSGIKVVKAFGGQEEEARKFDAENEAFFGRIMGVIRKKIFGESIVTFFNSFAAAAFYLVGGYMAVEYRMLSGGELTMFLVSLVFVRSPLKELTKKYTDYQESLGGCERIVDILDMPVETADVDGAADVPPIALGIEYRDVSFSYDRDPVLQGVSFIARPGQTVAIVGRSGAGKSTIVDLLCRFYDDYRGAILVDDVDIRRVRRASLLDNISIVSQDTFLFNTTIVDNIRYGKRNATKEEVIAAARSANIHTFIDALPEGYDTAVGDRGVKLSGGQRQRISIARAILKNPKILILDEATSALDTESERLVQGAINNLLTGNDDGGRRERIAFIIAHRLSTVKNADLIIVLDAGRVVEQGTHDELVASPAGTYHLLYNELQ